MPTINDYRQAYYDFTGLASSASRQLAFAGIAIIWLFRHGDPSNLSLPHSLLYPTIFFVLSLAFDLTQYFVASTIWGVYHRIKEKEFEKLTFPETHEFKAPVYFPWPQLAFFYMKVICVFIAYYQLFMYILGIINFK